MQTDTQAPMYLMNVSIDGGTPGAFRDLIDQPRGDQRFGVDESGRLYVFSKRTGEDIIYRTDLIANQNANAGDYNDNGIVDARRLHRLAGQSWGARREAFQ